jgi:hypothetical protein
MTNLAKTLISLHEAAALLPSGWKGRKRHSSTLRDWIVDGCRRPDGTRVSLKGTRVGSKWFVTHEDLEAFIAALSSLKTVEI